MPSAYHRFSEGSQRPFDPLQFLNGMFDSYYSRHVILHISLLFFSQLQEFLLGFFEHLYKNQLLKVTLYTFALFRKKFPHRVLTRKIVLIISLQLCLL